MSIEDIRAGDVVLSRDEHDPHGAAVGKVVEEVFVRLGPVWEILIAGRVIGTTQEHPFYAWEKGWVAARELAAGDTLLCEDGVWRSVDGVRDTGDVQTVYNLRVADFHTYFVGAEEWGWSVWAHNVSCQEVVAEIQKVTGVSSPFADPKLETGLAAKIAKNMTDYEGDTRYQSAKRTQALNDLDKLKGVGPATAAKIFWNILLKIGERYQQPEKGVVLSADRLDLMQKALYRQDKLDECVRIVLRPNSDYYLSSQGPHYFTDKKGRLDRIEFDLTTNSLLNGGDGNTTWVGKLGQLGDVGGHLVGRQFSGRNRYPNLVPMNGDLNEYPHPLSNTVGGGYGQLEEIWRLALTKSRDVSDVSIRLRYGTDDFRPTSFTLRFTIRGNDFLISFDNTGAALTAQQSQVLANAMIAATAP